MDAKTLHLLRQSPFDANDLANCCNILKENDTVVLLDDGCYTLSHSLLSELYNNCTNIFVIKQHAVSRGLKITSSIQSINITTLNQLIFEHSNSVTWQ